MELVSCILCGSDKSKDILKARDYRFQITDKEFNVVQCQRCGLIYVNPRPIEKEIARFYPQDYYSNEGGVAKAVSKLLQSMKIKKIMNFKRKGRILDVGCGDGEFLLCFKKRGWEVYGVDTSEHAYRLARRKLGRNVFNCDLKRLSFPDRFFDVITLNHVLEHMFDPNKELKEIHKILKDDGILLLSTPNIDSFQFKITKEHWFHLDIPRHLYHYSPTTIKNLLEINGFKVIKLCYPLCDFPLDLYHSLIRQHSSLKLSLPVTLLLKIIPQWRGTMEIIAQKI
jgi:2-polyprenyl-3-methyl-5-hydroxy-6-metoxy-1,4-benzoquinol methylase